MATALKTVEQVLDDLPTTLHAAMALAFSEIEGATKAALNPHFGKKYADIGAVIDAIKPPLIKYGLFFTQRNQPSPDGVLVETVLHHRGGEEMPLGSLFVPSEQRNAQKYGSALTYARRYALMTAFGVPAEDDDGNAAASAPARPTTGEEPPRKSKLDGPYDTIPKLEKAARQFVHTLRGIGNLADFNEWAKDADVLAFVEQCKRDLPGWWFANHADCPPDFTPLSVEVASTKRGLTELEGMENA